MWGKIKKYFSPLRLMFEYRDKVSVICCNDAIQHVFVGSDKAAKEKMEELAREYYETQQLKFQFKNYEDYRFRYFWHIHTVDCSTEGGYY